MASKGSERSIYLIDAYALIFQVFYAIREMRSPKGFPTNALFGFTRDLLFLHEEKRPDYLICVFDEGEPTFRTEVFAEYKANRKEMPDELQLQMEPIHQLLEAMNIPEVSCAGFEADDIIATVAKEAEKKGLDVYICTSDKDCRQLITDRVWLYNLRKNQILDREGLEKDWGVTPQQVIDLQSLVGDSVDNIDGVPGIGVKTAAKLLQEYGTAENLLANIDKVTGTKRRENLKAAAETVKRNRGLVRLKTDVPMTMEWESWRLRPVNAPRLLELFREWGFHRFADQVQSIHDGAAKTATQKHLRKVQVHQDGLFADDSVELEKTTSSPQTNETAKKQVIAARWDAKYHLINTAEQFREFLNSLKEQPRIAIDLETTALEPWRADIVGYALSWQAGEGWYVAVRGPQECVVLDPDETLNSLRPILEDERIAKINQNIKYDALVLRQQNIQLRAIASDSMVADYLLNAGEKNHNIANLARTYLQHEVIPITDLIGKKGPKQKRMDEIAPDLIAEYAGEDADVAWRLCSLLEEKLEQEHLTSLYDELEIPLIDVLVELEHNGIRLDVKLLGQLGTQLAGTLSDIEKNIFAIAGEEFNIGSLKQLRRVLFEKLKLPVRRRTGITGEASTDQETLEWLAAQGYEIPNLLLEHRRISKLKGTYIDALPKLVNPKTGRVHASFHQTVAVTGRLSSSDPNLQNIPIRSELGGQIRQAFLPEEGWTLLTADYSQIELRLLAHFADDPVLLRAFEEDKDIHSLVAAQIYGVEQKDVTADMRRMAKTVNFGVIYGMSAFGLAQRLQIKKEDAEAFIDAYFGRYPKVLQYQQDLLQRCREQGYVTTILGRRRSFQQEVIRAESSYRQRNPAEREAINMEIQGSAADLIKVAMLNIFRRLRKENRKSRMLLQIHDELVFECPPDELHDVGGLVHEEMCQTLADRLHVPLKVDLAAGPNWLDVEEW